MRDEKDDKFLGSIPKDVHYLDVGIAKKLFLENDNIFGYKISITVLTSFTVSACQGAVGGTNRQTEFRSEKLMFFIETLVQRITTVQNRSLANSSNQGNPIGGPVNRRGSKPGVEVLWYRRSRQET